MYENAPIQKNHAAVYHKSAPAYHEEYAEEVSPYSFTYAVADDYSKAAFNAEETSDGASNVEGSYSVALPDGRTQHVTYHSNGYDGYVADVTYDGYAQYTPPRTTIPLLYTMPLLNTMLPPLPTMPKHHFARSVQVL